MAALRHSAATALACRLRSSATSTATSSSAAAAASSSSSSSSSSFVRFSTSSERAGEGSVHFDDGSGEKLAEVLDHALVRRGVPLENRERQKHLPTRTRLTGNKPKPNPGQGEAQELLLSRSNASGPHDTA